MIPDVTLYPVHTGRFGARTVAVRRMLALCMKQTVNLTNYGNRDLNYSTR
jgi:hypothetical protein